MVVGCLPCILHELHCSTWKYQLGGSGHLIHPAPPATPGGGFRGLAPEDPRELHNMLDSWISHGTLSMMALWRQSFHDMVTGHIPSTSLTQNTFGDTEELKCFPDPVHGTGHHSD